MPGPTVSASVRARTARSRTSSPATASEPASTSNPAPVTTSTSRSGVQPAKNRPPTSSPGRSSPSYSPSSTWISNGLPTGQHPVQVPEGQGQPMPGHVEVGHPRPGTADRPPAEGEVLHVAQHVEGVGYLLPAGLEHGRRGVEGHDRGARDGAGSGRRRSPRRGGARPGPPGPANASASTRRPAVAWEAAHSRPRWS